MDIKYLIEQYKKATGVNHFDYHDKACQKELIEWVKERTKMGETYAIFLQEHSKINLNQPTCAEVGKSSKDTIIQPYKTSMITPYEHRLANNSKRLIIPNQFQVINGKPGIIITNKKNNSNFELISPETINTFITQNPYTQEHIANWEDLHNNGTDIAIGVYGNVSDKDRETKMRMLRKFRSQLEGFSKEEYGVSKDGYYYFVVTNRYTKKLVKTLNL